MEKEKLAKEKKKIGKKTSSMIIEDPYHEATDSNKHSPNQSPTVSNKDPHSKRTLEFSQSVMFNNVKSPKRKTGSVSQPKIHLDSSVMNLIQKQKSLQSEYFFDNKPDVNLKKNSVINFDKVLPRPEVKPMYNNLDATHE